MAKDTKEERARHVRELLEEGRVYVGVDPAAGEDRSAVFVGYDYSGWRQGGVDVEFVFGGALGTAVVDVFRLGKNGKPVIDVEAKVVGVRRVPR